MAKRGEGPGDEPDLHRDEVWAAFPKAHPLPYPEIGGIQIVSGTGYVLAWAKTEAGAWKDSLRLLRAMDEDAMRKIIRETQPWTQEASEQRVMG